MRNLESSDIALPKSEAWKFRALLFKRLSLGFLYPDSDPDRGAEYSRLFGSNPLCPLDLAHHLSPNPFEQARIMAQMAGFQRAFGVEFQEGTRPDHLAVCLEFLSYLCLKQTNALEKGLSEACAVTEKAIRDYIREYLLPGAEAFLRALQAHGSGFYEGLTEEALKNLKEGT